MNSDGVVDFGQYCIPGLLHDCIRQPEPIVTHHQEGHLAPEDNFIGVIDQNWNGKLKVYDSSYIPTGASQYKDALPV